MGSSLCIELAGETVELHGGRALFWPRLQRLLISDLHLGKADVFRRAGIGLPRGGTTHDLQPVCWSMQRRAALLYWATCCTGAEAAWRAPGRPGAAVIGRSTMPPEWPHDVHCPRPRWASNCSVPLSTTLHSRCATSRRRTRHCT